MSIMGCYFVTFTDEEGHPVYVNRFLVTSFHLAGAIRQKNNPDKWQPTVMINFDSQNHVRVIDDIKDVYEALQP